MRNQLLSLPSSLLALICASHIAIADRPWPYNLQPHEKYWPEHEEHIKRDAQIQKRMAWQPPAGVQKMSDDPGEKFYMDYWQFEAAMEEEGKERNTLRRRGVDFNDLDEQYANATMPENLLPPLLLHTDTQSQHFGLLRFFERDLLKRGYQCPTGTNSCSSIGRPNSCCGSGESCVLIDDSGLGDVGCCPTGDTCSGSVTSCDTSAGYTSCPESDNGGCCIPGYVCHDVGCIASSTLTKTTTLPAATGKSGSDSASHNSGGGTGAGGASGTTKDTSGTARSTSTTEVTTTTTDVECSSSCSKDHSKSASQSTTQGPSQTLTQQPSQGQMSCSSGFKSCPASLGGGCCATDRECGSAECPASTTTKGSGSAVAPVRPTGATGSSLITEGPGATSIEGCPTGFYMCSAYYRGGCCRVDRDCHSTSCPAPPTNTVLTSNGVTIVAPSGASFAAESGSCATGWFSCPASQGGGCCPTGYGCGSSCTRTTGPASASGSAVDKKAPSTASLNMEFMGWLMALAALVSGTGMLLL